MFETVTFVLGHYLMLAIFVWAFYGYGKLWEFALRLPPAGDRVLRAALRVAAGMGVFIIAMQLAGMLGGLGKDVVRLLLVAGMLLVFLRGSAQAALHAGIAAGSRPVGWNIWYCRVCWLAFAATLLLLVTAPLYPPVHWDDLMYHLPHVREWLRAGRLTINEWIRYPYFPFNFHLLFAASMAVTGDLNSGLMHALAGWLAALVLYRAAANLAGPVSGFIAAFLWLFLAKGLFETSYIDMGVALFILCAVVFFFMWLQDGRRQPALLVAAAFFLGLAAGTKYQAVVYLPFFALGALIHERRAGVWLKATLAFLLPCAFWYVRNTILTGNPVNPLAGGIFGYTDWNEADYAWQLADLRNARGWPPAELWLALLPLAFAAAWRDAGVRWLMLLSLYAVAVWCITSGYDRYLLPYYPVLSLLAALGIAYLARALPAFASAAGWQAAARRGAAAGAWALRSTAAGALVFALVSGLLAVKALPLLAASLQRLPVNADQRHGHIAAHARHFGLLHGLQVSCPDAKVYQFGLEGGLFYGPRLTHGDHFGPWRYRDYENLSAPQLHQRLAEQGFALLALDARNAERLEAQADFRKYFEPVAASNGDKAYRLLTP